MKTYVKNMVIEHQELCEKINNLHNFVYNEKASEKVNKVDYANMCIQLNAMKTYANALECRINNQGIYIDETGEYVQKVNLNEEEMEVNINGNVYLCNIDLAEPPVRENKPKQESREHNDDISMK